MVGINNNFASFGYGQNGQQGAQRNQMAGSVENLLAVPKMPDYIKPTADFCNRIVGDAMKLLETAPKASDFGPSAVEVSKGSGCQQCDQDSGNAVMSDGRYSQSWALAHIPASDRQAFMDRVLKIANKIGMDPDHLMAIMKNESGLKTTAVNKDSGATGLIQFMPDTAKSLGTSTVALKNMSALQQLDYVEKYLTPYKGKLDTLSDAYMAVFSPAFIGKGEDHVAYAKGQKAYSQNLSLDVNRDGKITNGELGQKLEQHLA